MRPCDKCHALGYASSHGPLVKWGLKRDERDEMSQSWRTKVERLRRTDPLRARQIESAYRRYERQRERDVARVFGESAMRMDDCAMRAPVMRGLTEVQSYGLRRCYLCGETLPVGKRRWCSSLCESEWHSNHSWAQASARAGQRDGWMCVRCSRFRGEVVDPGLCGRDGHPWPCPMVERSGSYAQTWPHYRVGGSAIAIEINHKVPLVGRGYRAGCEHHVDGLEALCHECHVAETTRQIRERRRTHVRRSSRPGAAVPA